jgi:hypothetical protein
MKLQCLLLPMLYSVALCTDTTLQKRDAKPVIDALDSISTAVKGLTVSISSLSSAAEDYNNVLAQADQLLNVLVRATAEIKALSPLGLPDWPKIMTPGNALIAEVQKVINTLITKKPEVDRQNLAGIVAKTLAQFKVGAAELVTTINSKLPSALTPVGNSILRNIDNSLGKGIAAYRNAPPPPTSVPSIFSSLAPKITLTSIGASRTSGSSTIPRTATSSRTSSSSTIPRSTTSPKSSTRGPKSGSSPKTTSRPKGPKGSKGSQFVSYVEEVQVEEF